MAEPDAPQIFLCPPHIRWAYESAHILVVNEATGQAHLLVGEEAAIWDWLMLGYSYARIKQFIAASTDRPTPQAEYHLRQQLAAWQERGLLQKAAYHG
ncbi:MAG TPA: hypothetical protein PLD25_29205 [Chloroflexota bacterium]|nr:hypothetical protein [Chloroflexota bacterium]